MTQPRKLVSAFTVFVAAVTLDIAHSEDVRILENGTVEVPPSALSATSTGFMFSIDLPRWGMFERVLEFGSPVDGAAHGWKQTGGSPDTYSAGRLYLAKPGRHEVEVSLPDKATAEALLAKLTAVRLRPAPEGDPIVQAPGKPIILQAKDATVWGKALRYEPNPKKLCIGYWTRTADWPEWTFTLAEPGNYRVTVFQGCGKRQGGSHAKVVSGDVERAFTVVETGHFQNFQPVEVGEIQFLSAGEKRLGVRATKKAAGAVMDIQKVVLEKSAPAP